jgi:hypothetical protein
MPTTIDSAGITFNDTTSLTSANIGTAQLVNGSVIASKLGTTEQKQIAKAWVNFNGTTSPGTIRSSYNVSSVTRNSTGLFTINFQNALTDANYSAVSSSGSASSGSCTAITLASTTSSSVQFQYQYAGGFVLDNASIITVQIFGN